MLLLKGKNRVQQSWKKNPFRKQVLTYIFHWELHKDLRIPYPLASWVLSNFLSPEPTAFWAEKVCLALVGQQPESAGPPDADRNVQGGVHDSRGSRPSWKAAMGAAGAGGCRKRRKEEVILLANPTPPLFPRRSSRCHQMNFSRLEWKLKYDSNRKQWGVHFCHFLSSFFSF